MKRATLRAVRLLTSSTSPSPRATSNPTATRLLLTLLSRFYASQSQTHHEKPHTTTTSEEEDDVDRSSSSSADFDSRLSLLSSSSSDPSPLRPIWDEAYRAKADQALFGGRKVGKPRVGEDVEEEEERSRRLAEALLEAALMQPDEEEEEDDAVKVEDQRSLLVGIVGAPNAGKSSLTNSMVGNKVAAVSRKTNTTTREILGVMTEGNTQICIFDTPGITLSRRGHPQKTDVRARVESAWKSVDVYDLLIVIFDVHRHLTLRHDPRVVKLINYLGAEAHPKQKRVLCMNKVDLVEDKKDLLKAAEEFKDLSGYDRFFMISGLNGSGVKDLVQYMLEQAVKRPWEEEPTMMSEEILKAISLEVVREKMLNHIHQEIPYILEHRLMDWKELRDGSLRIEQHFIAQKPSQRQILVGKNGSKIGRIGIEANEELRSIFKREVHLILQVRVARKHGA